MSILLTVKSTNAQTQYVNIKERQPANEEEQRTLKQPTVNSTKSTALHSHSHCKQTSICINSSSLINNINSSARL